MIVPFPVWLFIHIYECEKTPEEKEAEFRMWRDRCERERRAEQAEREAIAAKKRAKLEAKLDRERREDEAWRELVYEDEWQTRILPDGWAVMGQGYYPIIRERSAKDFPRDDV